MVLLWILNSRDIGKIIVYAKSAKEIDYLWNQFCQGNGPRLFPLQNEISSLTQDQNSMSVYYRKSKYLWDESMNYNQMPNCTCGVYKNCKCGATRLFFYY